LMMPPVSARSIPAMIFIRVDFPAPFGPASDQRSFGRIVKERSRNKLRAPYWTDTRSTASMKAATITPNREGASGKGGNLSSSCFVRRASSSVVRGRRGWASAPAGGDCRVPGMAIEFAEKHGRRKRRRKIARAARSGSTSTSNAREHGGSRCGRHKSGLPY